MSAKRVLKPNCEKNQILSDNLLIDNINADNTLKTRTLSKRCNITKNIIVHSDICEDINYL